MSLSDGAALEKELSCTITNSPGPAIMHIGPRIDLLQAEIEQLKTALRDARRECIEHNQDYDHMTPKGKLERWKDISR